MLVSSLWYSSIPKPSSMPGVHFGVTPQMPKVMVGSCWQPILWVGVLVEVALLPQGPRDLEEPKPDQWVSVCVLGALAGKGSAAVIEAGGMKGMLQNSGWGLRGAALGSAQVGAHGDFPNAPSFRAHPEPHRPREKPPKNNQPFEKPKPLSPTPLNSVRNILRQKAASAKQFPLKGKSPPRAVRSKAARVHTAA